jgi:hypothetical protein
LAAIAASVPVVGLLLGMLLILKAPIEAPPIKPAPLPAIELPRELTEPTAAATVDRTRKTSRTVALVYPEYPLPANTWPPVQLQAAPVPQQPWPPLGDPAPTSQVLRPHHRASFAGNNEICRRVGRRQVWVSSKRWRCLR